jgi:poly(A) polymerase
VQGEKLAITRRIAGDIKDIWALQPRFEQRAGKRPYALLEQPRFRAGYDFWCCAPNPANSTWKSPTGGHASRMSMATSGPMLLPEQAGDKKKRRRRKKPAAASSAAPASE